MFYIDLTSLNLLRVRAYAPEKMRRDMRVAGVINALELSNCDFKVFETEKSANIYLRKFEKVLSALDNSKICHDRKLPNLVSKRSYIVQAILGHKLYADSRRKKDWEKGQRFNLYDHFYFLTVELKNIKEIEKGIYRYSFRVPDKNDCESNCLCDRCMQNWLRLNLPPPTRFIQWTGRNLSDVKSSFSACEVVQTDARLVEIRAPDALYVVVAGCYIFSEGTTLDILSGDQLRGYIKNKKDQETALRRPFS